MEGGEGAHDDRVMALAIVNHIANSIPSSDLYTPTAKTFFSFFDSVRGKGAKVNNNIKW